MKFDDAGFMRFEYTDLNRCSLAHMWCDDLLSALANNKCIALHVSNFIFSYLSSWAHPNWICNCFLAKHSIRISSVNFKCFNELLYYCTSLAQTLNVYTYSPAWANCTEWKNKKKNSKENNDHFAIDKPSLSILMQPSNRF